MWMDYYLIVYLIPFEPKTMILFYLYLNIKITIFCWCSSSVYDKFSYISPFFVVLCKRETWINLSQITTYQESSWILPVPETETLWCWLHHRPLSMDAIGSLRCYWPELLNSTIYRRRPSVHYHTSDYVLCLDYSFIQLYTLFDLITYLTFWPLYYHIYLFPGLKSFKFLLYL